MNWGGIIAGAMGGGAAQANEMATQQVDSKNKLNLAKQLSDIDEARQMRVAERGAALDREGNKNKLQDTEDFSQKNFPNQLNRATTTKQAESKIDLETARQKGEQDAADLVKRASDPSYLKSVKALAAANRAPPSALESAQAEAVRFDLQNKKAIASARQDIASGDPAKVESGRRTLAALVMGQRSDSDMVGAAKVWEGLAKAARSELESPDFMMMKDGPEKESRKAEIMLRAQEAEQSARDVLSGMANNRGLINTNTPAAGGDDPLGLRKTAAGKPGTPAAAASPTGPASAATAAPAAPAYTPPPDSVVGKYRAQVAEREAKIAASKNAEAQQAAQAFEQVGTDRVAAGKLQAGPLFQYLSQDQKKAVYKIVNGQ